MDIRLRAAEKRNRGKKDQNFAIALFKKKSMPDGEIHMGACREQKREREREREEERKRREEMRI